MRRGRAEYGGGGGLQRAPLLCIRTRFETYDIYTYLHKTFTSDISHTNINTLLEPSIAWTCHLLLIEDKNYKEREWGASLLVQYIRE